VCIWKRPISTYKRPISSKAHANSSRRNPHMSLFIDFHLQNARTQSRRHACSSKQKPCPSTGDRPIDHLCSLFGSQISEHSFTYRSVQISESCAEDQMPQDLILRTSLCGTGFITQHSWVVHFRLTKMVRRKWFVPVRYQLPKSKSGGWPPSIFTHDS